MDKDKEKEKDKDKEKEAKEGEEEKEEEQVDKAPQIVEMKKGDYTVHVLIEEIKNCVPTEEDKQPNPVVKVTCFGNAKRTEKPPGDCTDYIFNEHFYFDKTNLSKQMLDSEKIVLEVYDSKNTKREAYFGIQEFDFSYIYSKEMHAIQNLWVALANPEAKDITQVRGYLKISISVLHENDERIELEMKESNDSDCLVPTQVKMEYRQLTIEVYKAEEIPDMDDGIGLLRKEKKGSKASCNGVFEVTYLGNTISTKPVKMNNQIIEWNEKISIPVTIPVVSSKMVFMIKDHETIGKDDLVGSIEVSMDNVFKGKYEKCTYLDIYGSYVNTHSDEADLMNTNAEIGSRWKGRVLLSIKSKKVDKAVLKVEPIMDNEKIQSAKKTARTNLWTLVFGAYESYFLPEKEKMNLRICWADLSKETQKPEKAQYRMINWKLGPMKIQQQTCSDKIEEAPDIFIYLMNADKTKVYCFQRLRAEDVYKNNNLLTIKLIPEMNYKDIKSLMDSGILKIKMGVFNSQLDKYNEDDFKPKTAPKSEDSKTAKNQYADLDDLEDLLDDSKKQTQAPAASQGDDFKKYTVVAAVYMSKELLPANKDGKSDPYVLIDMGNGQPPQKTTTKFDTVNGIWNEKLIFKDVSFKMEDQSTWPIMQIKIIDYNITKDKDMNYRYIWLHSAPHGIDDPKLVKPKWFRMFLPKSNKKRGKLLLSFYVFSPGKEHLVNEINITPETIPYTCEFNLLGLRGLKPLSLLPVKKAYIKFDLNSMNFTGKKEDTQKSIKTSPGDAGPNPTINTIFKFDINLPKDTELLPELQCEVYDQLLGGMTKSLLGIFTLNTKKIAAKTLKRIEKDLKAVKDMESKKIGTAILGKSFGELENIAFGSLAKGIGNKGKESEISTKTKNIQLTDISGNKATPLIEEESGDAALKVSGSLDTSTNTAGVDPGPANLGNAIRIPKNMPNEMVNDPHYFVAYPVFKNFQIPGYMRNQNNIKDFLVEDEEGIPDPNLYFPVGYLLKVDPGTPPEKSTKHYRRIYRMPLENTPLGIKTPFNHASLVRGNFTDTKDQTSIFELMTDKNSKIIMTYENNAAIPSNVSVSSVSSNSEEAEQQGFVGDKDKPKMSTNFGEFKALLRICEKSKMDNYLETVKKYEDNPAYVEKLRYFKRHEEICKKMLLRCEIICRVYVLRLWELAKKDAFSESDPFIKIYLGDKLIKNESDKHQDDMKNCEWNQYYDIPCEMPGCGKLRIEVWDYDDLLSDDLIGATEIDLEDRFFDQKWQSLENKPIEIRPLIHPDESQPQGTISLWMEMFPSEERSDPKWDPKCIDKEPNIKYEARFVVWETEDMEMMDVEGTSDVYVLGYFNIKDKQSTDVHYRCQTGIASFNWRMLLPVETPSLMTTLHIDAYDHDFIGSDDFICGAKLELKEVLKIPRYLDLPIKFTRDYYKSLTPEEKKTIGGGIEFMNEKDDVEGIKFWVQCMKDGKKGGRILCSLEILPEWKANLSKVGKGRDEPNLDPYLPPPFGRFEFTLNPYKLVNQLVGPKFRRKCYCFICMCLCCVYLCCVIPYVIYHLSGELVNPFNK